MVSPENLGWKPVFLAQEDGGAAAGSGAGGQGPGRGRGRGCFAGLEVDIGEKVLEEVHRRRMCVERDL